MSTGKNKLKICYIKLGILAVSAVPLHSEIVKGFEYTKGDAGVAELVDVPDLGSGAARRGGSIPSARTKNGFNSCMKCVPFETNP